MTFPLDGFDAIHASPPCQDWSQMVRCYGTPTHGTGDLLFGTLARLRAQPAPWVIENVVGAPLPSAFILCGGSFGLGASGLDLNRHRQFETSFPMLAPPCQHRPGKTIGVYGGGINAWHRKKLGRNLSKAEMREAMGIDWMRHAELTQAIPPAYCEFIGEQLISWLRGDGGRSADSSRERRSDTSASPGHRTDSRRSTDGPEGNGSSWRSSPAVSAANAMSSPQSGRHQDAQD